MCETHHTTRGNSNSANHGQQQEHAHYKAVPWLRRSFRWQIVRLRRCLRGRIIRNGLDLRLHGGGRLKAALAFLFERAKNDRVEARIGSRLFTRSGEAAER